MKAKSKFKIFVGFILSLLAILYFAGFVYYKKTGNNFLPGVFVNNNDDQENSNEIDDNIKGKSELGVPDDFPVYENSNLLNTWSVEDKSSAVSLIWESSDSVREIVDYYDDKLRENRWEITSSIFTEESSIISFEKDNSKGFLGITEENNNTVISATIEFSK